MKTKFKEVAHLYLGVEVVNTIGKHMGKIVSVSIDGTATINPLDEFNPRVIILNSLKPILRPLSDITKEEISGAYEIAEPYHQKLKNEDDVLVGSAKLTKYLLDKGFDLFGLIESGEAIDKTKMNL